MKKVYSLLLSIIAICTVSCNNTESTTSSDAQLENTKWKYSESMSMSGITADIEALLHLKADKKFTANIDIDFGAISIPIPGLEDMSETVDGIWSYEDPYLYLSVTDYEPVKCEVKGDKLYLDASGISPEVGEVILKKQ